ncbi:hypothetical protein C8J55DRAFT_201613 [Lentinula edodes]|uniref:Uncharacterized protein n=1 Tax=Lentinula lateritia TaxID=40482 RepID=A0A9W8ZXF6_9AGAR|nr:hypothetical protein C8J55DRAFT_201613 [Lentinula edodes]
MRMWLTVIYSLFFAPLPIVLTKLRTCSLVHYLTGVFGCAAWSGINTIGHCAARKFISQSLDVSMGGGKPTAPESAIRPRIGSGFGSDWFRFGSSDEKYC